MKAVEQKHTLLLLFNGLSLKIRALFIVIWLMMVSYGLFVLEQNVLSGNTWRLRDTRCFSHDSLTTCDVVTERILISTAEINNHWLIHWFSITSIVRTLLIDLIETSRCEQLHWRYGGKKFHPLNLSTEVQFLYREKVSPNQAQTFTWTREVTIDYFGPWPRVRPRVRQALMQSRVIYVTWFRNSQRFHLQMTLCC